MRVAAIDQGTTSTRCLVIEDGGKWRIADSRRHAQHYPAPGWVEHDPEELLGNVVNVLQAAGPVDVIGIANQGESCLAWDAQTGAALSPVIVWLASPASRGVTGRVFEVMGGRLGLADGWSHGPAVDHDGAFDPSEIGAAVERLVAEAREPTPLLGAG